MKLILPVISNHFSCVTLVLLLSLLTGESSASEEQILPETPWQWLEQRRTVVSRNVAGFGRNLDAWLAGESIGNVTNETYLRVRFNQQLGSLDGYHSRARIGGSLDLPRTAERWKLIFESESQELNPLEDTSLGDVPAGDSVAGFRFLQQASDRLELSHGVGLRGSSDIDAYYRLRANYQQPLSGDWGLGIRQRVWHYDSEGWGYNTNVSFRRPLTPSQVLLISSDFRYQQSREQLEFGQSIAVHKTLSDLQTLSYEAGVFGVNKPNSRIDLYYAGVQYRRSLRDDWLFLEVIPQVVVERTDNWRPQSRLSINLEMLFFDF